MHSSWEDVEWWSVIVRDVKDVTKTTTTKNSYEHTHTKQNEEGLDKGKKKKYVWRLSSDR